MKYHYRVVNVFTRNGERLSGNPLCVFEDGSGLSDADMQALALQFNLSETSFILPASSGEVASTGAPGVVATTGAVATAGASKAIARVRIFTPAMELPFAGHPTLGTANVVRDLMGTCDSISLEMKAGVIPVHAAGDRWTLQANAPVVCAFEATQSSALAAALGVKTDDFAAAPLWVNAGMEQLLVPLASKEVVRRAAPGAGLDAFTNLSGKVSVYCFSPLAEPEMLVRFFFAKNAGSVAEDPATGSACANLGGYALATNAPLPLERVLHQGEQVGRPSILGLAVDAARTVRVSGEVIELGRGSIDR